MIMNQITTELKTIEFNLSGSNLVKEIANVIESGNYVNMPKLMRDFKSAVAKEIDQRRVSQSKAAMRLKMNRGSYRKYLFRNTKMKASE